MRTAPAQPDPPSQVVGDRVVFLPIVVDDPAEARNDRQLRTVFFAPFSVAAPKSNAHHHKPLASYLVSHHLLGSRSPPFSGGGGAAASVHWL